MTKRKRQRTRVDTVRGIDVPVTPPRKRRVSTKQIKSPLRIKMERDIALAAEMAASNEANMASLITHACEAVVLQGRQVDLIKELAVAIMRYGKGEPFEGQDLTLLRWASRKMEDNRIAAARRFSGPADAPLPEMSFTDIDENGD